MKERVKKYIVEYKKKQGKVPSPKGMAVTFDTDTKTIIDILKELKAEGFIKWYPTNGKKISSYYIPTNIEHRETVKLPPPEPEKKITSEVKGFSPLAMFVTDIIIRSFMGLVAIAVILVSASFSLKWTISFLDPFIAWILSVSFPLYTSFAIEAGIFIRYKTGVFLKSGKLSLPLASLILFMSAGITMCIELSAITIGLFNSRTDLIYSKSENISKNNNAATLAILKNEENQILKNSDYKYLQNKIESYKNNFEENSKEYKAYEKTFERFRSDFKNYETKLEDNRKKQKEILDKKETVIEDQTETIRKDFYAWTENNFHFAKAGVIEFITYLLPALFCVLLAPLGVFVAVGLYRRMN